MEPILPQSPQPQPVMPPSPAPVVAAPPVTATAPVDSSASDYPVQFSVEFPDKQSRVLAVFCIPFFFGRMIMLIPQMIILYFVLIAGGIAAWLNVFFVASTGHSSQVLHTFAVGVIRWSNRISSYAYGLTDKYPPFRLNP